MHVFHLDAGVKCTFCHAGSFDPAGVAPCESCHFESTAPLHVEELKSEPRCVDCHRFGAQAGVEPWGCARCHAGDPMKPAAHGEQRCEACHTPHGPRATVDCLSCHKDQHPGRNEHGCTTCHTPHAPKEKAERDCATCHRQPQHETAAIETTALFDRGHERCTDCHEAHDSKTKACSTCHLQVASPKHQRCTDCHDPHRVSPEEAQASCARCHEAVRVEHPTSLVEEERNTCRTCHVPHGEKKRPPLASACTTCHAVARRDDQLHNGRARCSSCHQGHNFVEPAPCVTCHKDQVALTAKLQPHQPCESCHAGGAHRPSPLSTDRTCARCHEAVVKSAPAGHADCAKCHEPHGGSLRNALTCASCHAPEAASKHGQTEHGCADCHRPHGPGPATSPPKCSTCHPSSELPGLHASSAHQACTSCHGGHGKTAPTSRADCTNCHIGQLAHQPQAPKCTGCHPFGGAPRP